MVCLPFSLVNAVLVSTAKTIPTSPVLDTPNYQRLAWYAWPGCVSTPLLCNHFTALNDESSLGKQIWPFFKPLNTDRVSPWPSSSQISELFSSEPHYRNWLLSLLTSLLTGSYGCDSAEHCERTPYYIDYTPLPCEKTRLQNLKQKSQFCTLVSQHCKDWERRPGPGIVGQYQNRYLAPHTHTYTEWYVKAFISWQLTVFSKYY